jgi:hypothetical protein
VIFASLRNWKEIGWKGVLAGIFVPLLAAFPWTIEILIAPVPGIQKIFLPYDGYTFEWVVIAFSYLIYFVLRGTGRLFFNVFAFASFGAFILALALAFYVGEDYPLYCMDLINNHFGWGVEGCAIENYLLMFFIALLVTSGIVFIWNKKNKKSAMRSTVSHG